jgi:hypothetical protein
MFSYKGCKGEKVPSFHGGNVWMLTYEDGTRDMASSLWLALMLCRKELKRAYPVD